MRIAQVLLSPRVGGAETLAASLEREWRLSGVDSRIFYLESSGSASSRFKRWRNLMWEIRDFGPAVVVAHSALPNLYSRLSTPTAIPVVTVLHSATDDFLNFRLRITEILLLKRTQAIVAVSAAQSRTYLSHFPRAQTRMRVIMNGVASNLPMKSPDKVGPNIKRIVTLARFAPQKNPSLWIDTIETLSAKRQDAHFEWWGPIAEDSESQELSRVARRPDFQGELKGATDEPGQVLLTADIFFHSSDREAHSVAILEAVAVGVPIVCSQYVGATLDEDIPFVAFETGNASAAVAAVESVMDDWPRAVAKSLAIRADIRAKYSSANCAMAYLELFYTLVPTPTQNDAASSV